MKGYNFLTKLCFTVKRRQIYKNAAAIHSKFTCFSIWSKKEIVWWQGGGQSSLQVSCRAYYSPTGGVLRHEACLWELVAAHQQGRGAATQMLAEVSVLERLANHSLCGEQQGSSLSSNTLSAYSHTNTHSSTVVHSKHEANPPRPALHWRMHKQVMKYRM